MSKKIINKLIPIGPEKILHTLDPFIFGVYHHDDFPQGNGKLAPKGRIPSSAYDFSNVHAPYRMYHGETIPGFPMHAHAGFETITIVMEGVVDHADGLGSSGRYANGDVQHMHAGRGLNHGEMFPLIKENELNPLRLFQIWIRSPKELMETDPSYKMLWNEDIPLLEKQNDLGKTTKIKVIFGSYGKNAIAPEPAANSWVNNGGDVRIYLIDMEPNGSSFKLPPANKPDIAKSTLWLYNNKDAPDEIIINGNEILPKNYGTELKIPLEGCIIENKGNKVAKLLLLEGNPIDEPYIQRGPFVAVDEEGLRKKMAEYRKTEFGGWPYKEHGPTFGNKSRFSILPDGTEETRDL